MAKRSTRNLEFLKLPSELRNAIYEFVLAGQWQTIRIPFDRPALLQACKQIASEASPILCGLIDFYASLTTSDVSAFSRSLAALGPDGAKAVTSFLDLDMEIKLHRTSKSGGAGVMNYPHWLWNDVPRLFRSADIRSEVVTIVNPLAMTWTARYRNIRQFLDREYAEGAAWIDDRRAC